MHPEPSFTKKRDHTQRRPPFPKNYSTRPDTKKKRRRCSLLHPQAPSSRPTPLPPLRFGSPGRGQKQTEQSPAPGFTASATAKRREPHNRLLREWRPSPQLFPPPRHPSSAPPRPEVTSWMARRAAPRERRAEGGGCWEAGGGARPRLRFRWLLALAHPSCSHSLPWLLPPSWYFLEPPSWFFQSARTQNRK